jgi:glycosyltransferase involved in cell wall biosynthesis
MKVSVIIPVLNEEKYIAGCLDSILNQNYEGGIEIILVDGGSNDKTLEIISSYMHNHDNLVLLNNPKRIFSTAMNIGIKESSGDLIICMGAHAQYASDYISKCVEWSEKTGADNVGGPALAKGEGYIGTAIALAHYSPFGLGGAKFRTGNYEGYVDTVFGGAFKREVFDKVGLYDERLVRNQDIELNYRINANGGKCFMTPEIKVSYFCRNNLKDLWKQNFNNGLWSIYTTKVAKQALSLRHFVPLLFVLSLIFSGLLSVIGWVWFTEYGWWFALPLLLCLGSYLSAAIVFSSVIAFKHVIKYLPALLVVFSILHISYGMGSVKGLLTLGKWMRENKLKG